MLSTAHEATFGVWARCCWTESVKCARPTTLIWSTNTQTHTHACTRSHISQIQHRLQISKSISGRMFYSRYTAVRVYYVSVWVMVLSTLSALHLICSIVACKSICCVDFCLGCAKERKTHTTSNNINSYDTSYIGHSASIHRKHRAPQMKESKAPYAIDLPINDDVNLADLNFPNKTQCEHTPLPVLIFESITSIIIIILRFARNGIARILEILRMIWNLWKENGCKWKFIWCIAESALLNNHFRSMELLWFRQMRDRMIKTKQNETKILSAWSITVQAASTEALSIYFCPICRLFRTYSVMTLFSWESHGKNLNKNQLWNMCTIDETVLNVWLFVWSWSYCRQVNK